MQGFLSETIKEPAQAVLPQAKKRLSAFLNFDFLAIGFFVLLEVLIFGPNLFKVGFYLDDWLMLSTLRFGPQDLFGAFSNYFFNDPKVIIRPVEVLHFGLMYFLFGIKPLGYHVVNAALEICCSVLLYVALKQFTNSRFLSCLVTCGFIIYPVRDSTHYWILCSSVALSLALYLGSLIFSLKAVKEKKPVLYAIAALPFAFSIFNYEVFMPLAGVTAASVFFFARRSESYARAFLQAVFSFLPLFLSGVSLFAYQRFLVPNLGVGYLHRLTIDPAQILHVIGAGTFTSSLFGAMPFFQRQAELHLTEPQNLGNLLALTLIFSGTVILSFRLLAAEADSIRLRTCMELVVVGILAIVSSLAIFGLNKEYEPTLMTLVNRMFTGASLGWNCIFAGLFFSAVWLIFNFVKVKTAQQCVLAILSSGLAVAAVFFTLVNWQLAQPWVVSKRAQSDVYYLLRGMRGKVKHPDVIILSDFPRYVMWCPVFDGIWDFQSMARVALEDPKIQAGVVCDRLVVEKRLIKDVSVGYTCASYPIENVKVFLPTKKKLLPVASAREFVDIVSANYGQSFVSPETIKAWRKQVQGAEK